MKMYPDKLYKYLSPGDYIEDTLRNGTFLLRRPNTFNDPFDCSPHSIYPNKKEKNTFAEGLIRRRFGDLNRKNFRLKKKEFMQNITLNQMGIIVKDNIEEVRKYSRILCLTQDPKEILMWAHYGKEHKGVCIEIDFSRERNDGRLFPIFDVKYVKNRPGLGILDLRGKSAEEIFESVYCKKYEGWNYEKEWRFIHNPNYAEEIINSPPLRVIGEHENGILVAGFSITKVFLGRYFDESKIEQIRQICDEKQIDLVRVDLEKDKYEMVEKIV